MNVLVAVASKHGSTTGIAEVVADELRTTGIAADVWSVDEAPPLELYDAIVVGSAIYVGRWMPEARRFVEASRAALRDLPVWLFSSGPIGDPPAPAGDSADLDRLATELGARGHRTFAGRLDPGDLGLGERLVVKAVRAPKGDFRQWEEIRGWAREIAAALRHEVTPADPAAEPVPPEQRAEASA
jgi:menaquinone-dependent protoporphyrinogen oxidase